LPGIVHPSREQNPSPLENIPEEVSMFTYWSDGGSIENIPGNVIMYLSLNVRTTEV